jgi:hypothetical protein
MAADIIDMRKATKSAERLTDAPNWEARRKAEKMEARSFEIIECW